MITPSLIRRHPYTTSAGVLIAITYFALYVYPRAYILGPSRTGDDVAHVIADQHLDPQDCLRIYHFDIGMRPSTGQDREFCLYTLALLTSNPVVCEMLIPSDYGMRCIAEVNSAIQKDYCAKDDSSSELSCIQDGKTFTQIIHDIHDCTKFSNFLVRDWCYEERSFRFAKNECGKVSTEIGRDSCLMSLAKSEKSLARCDEIHNPKLRTTCQVLYRTYKKYPELK